MTSSKLYLLQIAMKTQQQVSCWSSRISAYMVNSMLMSTQEYIKVQGALSITPPEY